MEAGVMEFVPREEFELLIRTQNGRLQKIEGSIDAIWKKLDGRPSWTVLVIITTLSSAVVGLLVNAVR